MDWYECNTLGAPRRYYVDTSRVVLVIYNNTDEGAVTLLKV